jgi:hypothetical protein
MQRQSLGIQLLKLGAFLVGGFGVLVGALWLLKAATGAKVGEKCDDANSCTNGAVCISQRCQRSCSKDSDCPAQWTCGNTDVWVTTSGLFQSSHLTTGSEKICFSPEQMAPVLREEERRRAADAARDAENRKAISLIMKRSDVHGQVIIKTLTISGSKLEVKDPAFEKAWAAISDGEKLALSSEALADRIIATSGTPR